MKFKEIKEYAGMSYKQVRGKCAAAYIVSLMLMLAVWLTGLTLQLICIRSFGPGFLYGWQALLFYIAYILVYIFVNLPLRMGVDTFYSAVACRMTVNVDNVFRFFTHEFSKAISAQKNRIITKLVLAVLAAFASWIVYNISKNIVLSVILFVVLIVAILIFANIKYAAIAYIMTKNPDLSIDKSVRKGVRLIKGRRRQIFLFMLSMIHWYLLGIISLGIAYIWIIPYINISVKSFYLKIERSF